MKMKDQAGSTDQTNPKTNPSNRKEKWKKKIRGPIRMCIRMILERYKTDKGREEPEEGGIYKKMGIYKKGGVFLEHKKDHIMSIWHLCILTSCHYDIT